MSESLITQRQKINLKVPPQSETQPWLRFAANFVRRLTMRFQRAKALMLLSRIVSTPAHFFAANTALSLTIRQPRVPNISSSFSKGRLNFSVTNPCNSQTMHTQRN